MARTEAGATLTETHRRGQLQLRARALRDFALLWPLWTGDERSFQRLLAASMPLIRGYHDRSSGLATGYYEAFRTAERVAGPAAPRPAPQLDEEVVRGTLHYVGADMTRRAVLAGYSPQAAMQTALVRTSGTVTRFTMQGGRDAVLLSSAEDRQARGWARVTGGDSCPFCLTLASRGAAYLSESTAEFQAHDHCSCAAEVQYDGAALPESSRRARETYEAAQRWARENPDQAASGTANDALTNLRRYVNRQ